MRSIGFLIVAAIALTPVAAQSTDRGEIPLGDILREDGTIDVDRPFHGAVDLSGFHVHVDSNGTLRASAEQGGQWLPGEQLPGLNWIVFALAWGPDGALYVGGGFRFAGGIGEADRIARWTPDGTGGGEWSALGAGVNDVVTSLAWGPDGALYVGGLFSSAGGVPGANHVARWTPDGTATGGAWSALGIGVQSAFGSGVNSEVRALAWGSDGALYVGGHFTHATGVSANNIARWTPDGTGGAWSTLGPGLAAPVSALSWGPDGALYVGGSFTWAGGVYGADYVARWTPDGVSGAWSALGSGMTIQEGQNGVHALAWGPDGALYVGGAFTHAGGVSGTNHIARWVPSSGTDGNWSALGVGLNSWVYALAWGPDGALYAGGPFTSTHNAVTSLSRMARWTPDETGGEWSTVGAGVSAYVRALAWGPDAALYAGGAFGAAGEMAGTNHVARWTPDGAGGAWRPITLGVNNSVHVLARGPDGALYVGGGFTVAGGVSGTNRIARWTPDGQGGGEWSALGSGVNNVVRTLAWGPDGALYVGGNFNAAGGVSATWNIARWTPDGTATGGAWSALGPGVSNVVRALAWGPDGALYVGGDFLSAGGVAGANYVARWTPDGISGAWSVLGSGMTVQTWQNGVHALAWGPDDALYMGGRFDGAGGVANTRNIARWTPDGPATSGAWSALASGTGPVAALSWGPDHALYVGGLVGAPGITRWTPTTGADGVWSIVGAGITGPVHALAWGPDDALYVGGRFDGAGGVSGTYYIAQWVPSTGTDGTWGALGSGMNSSVAALAWGPDRVLHVGGEFTQAGGGSSAFFARWQAAPPVSAEPGARPAAFALEAAYPNPSRGATTIRFAAPEARALRVVVYDALGRQVAVLFDGEAAVGRHEVSFDGGRFAAGVYIVHLSGDGISETRRITLVK